MEVTTQAQNDAQATDTSEGVEIYRNAVVNVLPVGEDPENGPFTLATVVNEIPDEKGLILVSDLDGLEYGIPVERLQVYPPFELLVLVNRHHLVQDVMAGLIDPVRG